MKNEVENSRKNWVRKIAAIATNEKSPQGGL